ncbi:hypothetical protein OIB37_10990 [Streptomyces sp. NBC_00820]|uniref:hypothetical protein n=1 Tax=Streptomyces sp. NBC_00820 TaxID=2975842 RepID=UPI002ED10E5E|nr:hypothetical protein OIB37_10990 [Streptomyces sp. NBC_00820]
MSEDKLPDILDHVLKSVRDFTEAEVALAEAEQRLVLCRQGVMEQVQRLRDGVEASHAPELITVLRHLYWQQPGIHGRALAQAAGLTLNDMLATIGPAPAGILCAECGVELLRTSRSWQPPARPGPPLCPDCVAVDNRTRSRRWHVQTLRSRIIREARVPATVREWRAATELVLAYPPLIQGIRRGSEADLQEGVWRGWENARGIRTRLINAAVVDDDVWGITVEEARLLVSIALKVVDWDTARTRDIVDPTTDEAAVALLSRLQRAVRDEAEAAQQRADAAYPEGYEPSEDEINEIWGGMSL